jgi:hypothetical protein
LWHVKNPGGLRGSCFFPAKLTSGRFIPDTFSPWLIEGSSSRAGCGRHLSECPCTPSGSCGRSLLKCTYTRSGWLRALPVGVPLRSSSMGALWR